MAAQTIPLTVTSTFLAKPAIVFDAWVKPELIRKWLFVGVTSELINVELDLKVEGKFSIVEHEKSNDEQIEYFGRYIEIDAPNKLVFSLSAPKHFHGESIVTVNINATEEGCLLKLIQSGVSKDIMEESWKRMLEQLKLSLEVW